MNDWSYISDELLLKWIRRMRAKRFFGKTILCWENGKIVHVKIEETLKMNDFEAEILKGS